MTVKTFRRALALIVSLLILVGSFPAMYATAGAQTEYNTELPPKPEDTYRYYFYVPNDEWIDNNPYTDTVGIYWWEGDNIPDDWPGHSANPTGVEGVYYYDVPRNVPTIIWNNFVEDGTDIYSDIYENAYQTKT